ncbi:hypothetical protein ENBRE01_2569 [Enteropsectra breve]|nr:hypothetical protein ENBRE01_2569 [Enteropsectra breve]
MQMIVISGIVLSSCVIGAIVYATRKKNKHGEKRSTSFKNPVKKSTKVPANIIKNVAFDLPQENDLPKILTKDEIAVEKKAKNDLRVWLDNLKFFPLGKVAESNSQPVYNNYETMYVLAKFLLCDPLFNSHFKYVHFDPLKQPYLWFFEWVANFEPSSHNLLKDKLYTLEKRFSSYIELMEFTIKKISEEDFEFVGIFNNKLDMIASYDDFQSNPNNIISINKENQGDACKQFVIANHRLIKIYNASKITTDDFGIKIPKYIGKPPHSNSEACEMNTATKDTKGHKIRAIGFKSMSSNGNIMLNYISVDALDNLSTGERDYRFKELLRNAVFILYEEWTNSERIKSNNLMF